MKSFIVSFLVCFCVGYVGIWVFDRHDTPIVMDEPKEISIPVEYTNGYMEITYNGNTYYSIDNGNSWQIKNDPKIYECVLMGDTVYAHENNGKIKKF